jgi:hypothetical protein
MADPTIDHLVETTGLPRATVEKVLQAWRDVMTSAFAPGGASRFELLDLATLRVTTEPVGPTPSVSGKARSVTATIPGVYARMVHVTPTLTLRAVLEPILVGEELFVGLFDEPWSRWRHGYGAADDVPHELWHAASRDPEKRADARKKLRSNLLKGGTAHPAAGHAVAYLIRLARTEQLPERAEVLELVRAIATAGKPEGGDAWWETHLGLLEKERAALEALQEDPALGDGARAILNGAPFRR